VRAERRRGAYNTLDGHKTRGAAYSRSGLFDRARSRRSFIQAREFGMQTPPARENHSGCGGS
jgi:Flp pilus assembly protein TadD